MSTVHEWSSVRGERDLCLQYTNDYQQEVRGIYVYSTRMIISKRWEGFMSTVHNWLSVRGIYGTQMAKVVRGIYVYSTRMTISKRWEGFMLQYTNDYQ